MKRSWPVFSLVVLYAAFLSMPGFGQDGPVANADSAQAAGQRSMAVLPDNPEIPADMQQLMRSARQKYLEGSGLLQTGEAAAARAAFDEAVNLVLQSRWDVSSTPVLNRFFQDLIYEILQDESRYLTLPQETEEEEKAEGAVVDELDDLDIFPITVEPSLADVVEADLANTKYDIPVMLNERVLQYLNYFLNSGRKYFSDGLVRSGKYKDMIHRIFREESIPLDIMYLAQVESLFKTNALSRAQAKGIWQFGRWTAIRYGLKVNAYIDERSDPEKSTRAAAKYLNDLYGMFKDWNLVLAAYNWGERNVQKLINRSGINDFWDLMELRRNFPRETKNHVPLIMASVILAKNPAKYGLPVELDEPLSYDRIVVSKAIDLRAAANILNTTVDHLKQLNPALRGMSTPADYPDFELKVPVGAAPDASEKLAALPAVKFRPPAEYASRHRVRRGDTLSSIASRYRVSIAELMRVNRLSSSGLRIGTLLSVPRRTTAKAKLSTASRRTPSRPSSARLKSTVKSAPVRAGVVQTSSKSFPKSAHTAAGTKSPSQSVAKSVKETGPAKKGTPAAAKSAGTEKKGTGASSR